MRAAGGVKVDELGIDLAIAIAIASSDRDKGIRPTDAFVGEIGLTGEIRRVPNVVDRILEAKKLGFKRVFVPKHAVDTMKEISVIQINDIATLSLIHLWRCRRIG